MPEWVKFEMFKHVSSGPKVGQIGTKQEKSVTFQGHISVHFGQPDLLQLVLNCPSLGLNLTFLMYLLISHNPIILSTIKVSLSYTDILVKYY